MTDTEKIIKGIEICSDDKSSCKDCPYYDLKSPMCLATLHEDATNLVKRQQEEINHFAEVNKMVVETDKTEEVRVKCEEVINKIRAEAVREFSHKVIDYICEICVMPDIAIEMVNGIDNLAKEFAKDTNVRTNPEQVKGEENG